MRVYITYPSALEYWLYERGVRASNSLKKSRKFEISGRLTIGEILKSLDFQKPVHVAVTSGICRRPKEDVVFHLIPKNIPQGSYVQISETVFIASPELCFLLAASVLPLHQLVLLANRLCAQYVYDQYEEFLQRHREPITSTGLIKKYLGSSKGVRGVNPAKTAIKYALDNSNSPMESKLATIAMLPLSRGGYALIRPELNLRIPLPKNGPQYIKQDYISGDMVWMKQMVVLEYDSNLTHLTPRQHSIDKARISELSAMDFQIISVTREKIYSFQKIEELFISLRGSLKIHSQNASMKKYFEKRWEVVHDIMLKNVDNFPFLEEFFLP